MSNDKTDGQKPAATPVRGRIRKDIRKMARDLLGGLPPDDRMIDVLKGRKGGKSEEDKSG